MAANDARFETSNLWLVAIGSGGPRVIDLKPAADKAARDLMHKRDPRDFAKYGYTYAFFDYSSDNRKQVSEFKDGSLTVHFDAGVGKSMTDTDAGSVTFALPKGNVTHIAADPKKQPMQ